MIRKKGSYAIILYTEERELRLQGPCDCSTQCISSYRAEIMGILAAHYLLHSFQSLRNIPTKLSAPLYCDNISAVRSSNRNQLCGVTVHLVADYDILSEIRTYRSCGIDIKAEWVKAHQDDNSPLEDPPPISPTQLHC